jgi:hypothetical protein
MNGIKQVFLCGLTMVTPLTIGIARVSAAVAGGNG